MEGPQDTALSCLLHSKSCLHPASLGEPRVFPTRLLVLLAVSGERMACLSLAHRSTATVSWGLGCLFKRCKNSMCHVKKKCSVT